AVTKSVMARKPRSSGQVPVVGLNPTRPQNAAGIRMDPPPSEPSAAVARPPPTDAAAPPLDPPEVREGSQGFAVSGMSRFSFVAEWQNSGTFVLPGMTTPARRSRATAPESERTIRPLQVSEPNVVS